MRMTILIMTHTAERSFRTDVYSSRLEPLFQSVASVTANTLARHIRQGRECRLQLAGLTALIWLLLGSTGLARRLADWVPRPALLGVILGLGFGFMLEGIRMIATSPWLGGALLLMALVLLSRPTVVGHLLFGLFVDGFWSALACRALSGIGWAGTYMTGLKLLADRVDAKMMSRATAGHAASICLSGALSFATGDWLARLAGAFLAASISALAAWIIIAVVVPRQQTAVTKQTNGSGLYAKPFGDGLCNGVRHSHA